MWEDVCHINSRTVSHVSCVGVSESLMQSSFYDYQGGHIRLNGTELSSLDLKPYRQSVSLVSQEPTLYQGKESFTNLYMLTILKMTY